jgi:hypothetical protein
MRDVSQELVVEASPVSSLPVRRTPGTIEVWGREVPVAVAAGAGAAAGAAVIAVARSRRAVRRVPRRGMFRKREKIVARRSFLVDVHVLGR